MKLHLRVDSRKDFLQKKEKKNPMPIKETGSYHEKADPSSKRKGGKSCRGGGGGESISRLERKSSPPRKERKGKEVLLPTLQP